jgi:hypothetical protein
MKSILCVFAIFSTTTFASAPAKGPLPDQDWSCVVTSENKRYEDVFLLELREQGYSHLRYKRKHLAAPPGEYGELEIVRGCYQSRQIPSNLPERSDWIEVQCRDDGQEGSIDIDPKTGYGEIYFFMPQIGYPERTDLTIQCERSR